MTEFINPGDLVGEVFQIQNFAGEVLEFNSEIYLPVYTSFGTAPIKYITTKGYRQDGLTLIDLFLEERSITVEIYNTAVDSREDWWELRRSLVSFFKASLGQPLTLTILQAGGIKYSIEVYADPGPVLNSSSETNQWDINEKISLVAHNPLWVKDDSVSLTPSATEDFNLVFPITFPIEFGSAGAIFDTGSLNYAGSWKSYPTITIEGPYTTCTVLLVDQEVSFQLVQPILAGESRIITTNPSELSLVDGAGNSKFDDLSLPSNLSDFSIPSAPEGLTEKLKITLLSGTVGVSNVIIQYNENYLGI